MPVLELEPSVQQSSTTSCSDLGAGGSLLSAQRTNAVRPTSTPTCSQLISELPILLHKASVATWPAAGKPARAEQQVREQGSAVAERGQHAQHATAYYTDQGAAVCREQFIASAFRHVNCQAHASLHICKQTSAAHAPQA